MINQDEAFRAVGLLAGSLPYWPEAATLTFVEQFQKHCSNADALYEVCETIATTWKGKDRPSLGEVLDVYRAHPDVVTEREMRTAAALAKTATDGRHCTGSRWVSVPGEDDRLRPCPRCNPYLSDVYADKEKWAMLNSGTPLHELHHAIAAPDRSGVMHVEVPMPPPCKVESRYDPDRYPDFAEGEAIWRSEYRSFYGREFGAPAVANPVYAADIIQRVGQFDVEREVWHATYVDVRDGFGGHHPTTQASLKALGGRLDWDNRGRLTLRPERTPEPPAPRYTPALPPMTPEPTDVSTLMRDAIGDTARRITD